MPCAANATEFAAALETCRRFLLAIASGQVSRHLAAKGGASDLVQDTFAAAYAARDRFRGATMDDLRAWLRGILGLELAMFHRRFAAGCRCPAREVGLSAADHGHPARGPGPVDHLIRAESDARLDAAVAGLPDDDRRVLALRFEDRLGFREIGERLGRSEDAARKLFARAVARLRDADPIAP